MPQEAMTDSGVGERKFNPPGEFVKQAHIKSMDEYKKMYERSIKDPEGFWGEDRRTGSTGSRSGPRSASTTSRTRSPSSGSQGGKTNIAYNCLDRHLEQRGDQVAIIWEGNEPGEEAKLTYRQLHARGLQVRQRAEEVRRQEGRPRVDLHADGQGAGRSRCWPVPGSARSTRSCSAASARIRWPTASWTRPARSWSRPTASSAAPRP